MAVHTRIPIAVGSGGRRSVSAWAWRGVLAGLALLLWGPLLARGQSYVGKGHRVLDGDTIYLLRETGQIVRVELYGIDAPERGQPFADAAARAVRRVVFRTDVRARAETDGPDGRSLFVVRMDDRVLNEHLLRRGLAWWDRRQAPHADRYRRLEQRARANERGLWAQPDPVPPWTWRGRDHR
ncbi:thermonuclease family protein [Salinibacter ruber]|uniref:Protein parB n=2 Tax=Salinibacter ruber TaxID=146919 RepID=Q2S1K6_SALRD|nr:thermonuclease family protein [Salinibacter ruber]ABC44175.1 protein parB [Salinibacter ruber DSM 13855]CBH24941.1 Putative endonuclease [Salinibacter ruber M8]